MGRDAVDEGPERTPALSDSLSDSRGPIRRPTTHDRGVGHRIGHS